MAWPLDPLTTYVPGALPPIKAADLNAIQSAINSLYNGTRTVQYLFADVLGGGFSRTPIPGLVVANGLVTKTTFPQTIFYYAGTVAQGTVARAWAVVNANGTFARGYNTSSVQRWSGGSPTGDYSVVFGTRPSDLPNGCPWATIIDDANPTGMISAVPGGITGFDVNIRVRTYNSAGASADRRFSVGIYGE